MRRLLRARWLRVAAAFVIVAGFSVVLVGTPGGVVEAADEPCMDHMIPGKAFDDVVVSEGGTAALAAAPAAAPAVVNSGGATLTAAMGGSTAATAGAALAITGAVFLGLLGGCAVVDHTGADEALGRFFDWVTGDGDNAVSELVGVGSITSSSGWRSCSALRTYLTGNWPNRWCIELQSETPLETEMYWRSNMVAGFTIGGNVFPDQANQHLYGWGTSFDIHHNAKVRWPFPHTNGSTVCAHDESTANGICRQFNGLSSWILASIGAASAYSPTCPGSDVYAGVLGRGIGGNCGRPPNELLVGYLGTDVKVVTNLNPAAAQTGWHRRIYTDVECVHVSSGGSTWVRAQSPIYSDRSPSTRAPIAECEIGTVPRQTRIQRVPIGVTCALGTVCYGNGSVIAHVTLPSHLTATATAPDWIECLQVGNECGEPVWDGSVCEWPAGVVVDDEFCTGLELDPETDPSLSPRATGQVEPPAWEEGVTVDTGTLEGPEPDPDEGGGGSGGGVDVPIDEGDNGKCSLDVEACFGALPDPGSPTCLPGGWHRFNPIQWVLQPVKCALRWAFVPDTTALQEDWDDLKAAANAHAPFSWATNGLAIAHEVVDGAPAAVLAHDGECITFLEDAGTETAFLPPDWDGIEICLGEAVAETAWVDEIRPLVGHAVWLMFAIGAMYAGLRLWGVGKTETFYLANEFNPGGV